MSHLTDISPTKKIEGKNGLAFEVILDSAKSNTTPAKLTPHNTPTRLLTNDDIKNKLAKAEERRLSLEVMKLCAINEKFQKIEEAAKIREEYQTNFSKQAEQKLQSKMESNKENRINLMNNLREKLKKTDAKIAQIREMSSTTSVVLEEKIKSKLISAEENRVEKLQSTVERLKEHEKHIEEVRKAMNASKEELEEKLIQKYQTALNYREEQIEKIRKKFENMRNMQMRYAKRPNNKVQIRAQAAWRRALMRPPKLSPASFSFRFFVFYCLSFPFYYLNFEEKNFHFTSTQNISDFYIIN